MGEWGGFEFLSQRSFLILVTTTLCHFSCDQQTKTLWKLSTRDAWGQITVVRAAFFEELMAATGVVMVWQQWWLLRRLQHLLYQKWKEHLLSLIYQLAPLVAALFFLYCWCGWLKLASVRRWQTDGLLNHLPSVFLKLPELFQRASMDDFPDGCVRLCCCHISTRLCLWISYKHLIFDKARQHVIQITLSRAARARFTLNPPFCLSSGKSNLTLFNKGEYGLDFFV